MTPDGAARRAQWPTPRRIVDRKVGINTSLMQIANSVTNSADFRRAVETWARQLRNGLDRLNARAG